MTLRYMLLQNLRRNPLRTGLTLLAFALPMGVFVAAISLVVALMEVNALNARELRLVVQSRIALVNELPERVRAEIEALDPERQRLSAVCGMLWFGGRVPDTQNETQSLGVDHDTFAEMYGEWGWTDAEREAWGRDRRACVVGSSLAQQYGWQLGQRVTLESTIPPYLLLEFVIVKLVSRPGETNSFYLRRDYFEEARRTAGFDQPGCNVFWVRCTSRAAMESLQQQIDEHFRNTPNETKCLDENAFGAQFVQAAGDIPGLMQTMAVVVVFIIALVGGNTMMMNFRERTRELAVFKAIGFSSLRVGRLVLAESVLLAVLGAGLGVLATWAALSAAPLAHSGFLPIASLSISPIAIAVSLAIAAGVGVVAGAVPAVQALRLRTVDALRRVA
ncbi:MAG TPA: ABC transporter permease [Phycisphaerae bacterium]|nr:ABC transporter permease [Phycisphaerae bacterium]